MILMAVGIYALTTSSQDIKAVARSVSEGNALAAAEAGVHILCAQFITPANPISGLRVQYPTNNPSALQGAVDAQGNVTARYSIVGQGGYDVFYDNGYSLPGGWHHYIYSAQVTGFDNLLGGQVILRAGVYDPMPKAN